jgi:hypothetical protein
MKLNNFKGRGFPMDPIQTLKDLYTEWDAFLEKKIEEGHKPSIDIFLSEIVLSAIIGAIFAAIIGAPLAITASLCAAKGAIHKLSDFAVTELAENYNWEKFNVVLIRATTDVIFRTALIVALVSLGIFGATAATIFGIGIGCFFLHDLSKSHSLRLEEQPQPIPV